MLLETALVRIHVVHESDHTDIGALAEEPLVLVFEAVVTHYNFGTSRNLHESFKRLKWLIAHTCFILLGGYCGLEIVVLPLEVNSGIGDQLVDFFRSGGCCQWHAEIVRVLDLAHLSRAHQGMSELSEKLEPHLNVIDPLGVDFSCALL